MPWEKMIKGYPESFVLKGPFQLTGRRQDPRRDRGYEISGFPKAVIPGAAWAEAWVGICVPPHWRNTFTPEQSRAINHLFFPPFFPRKYKYDRKWEDKCKEALKNYGVNP